MELTELELKEIFAHAEEGYPDEVCGVVIGKPGDPTMNAVRRCANLANQYHKEDPVRYPRDARTAYIMDPMGLMQIQADADANAFDLVMSDRAEVDPFGK